MNRGQFVLVAAAVIAIALTTVLFAYLQLGYHPDIQDNSPDTSGEEAVQYLDRSVHNATAVTAGEHDWENNEEMVEAIREEVGEDIDTLEKSRISDGVAYDIDYNGTLGAEEAATNCQSGENREFGSCESVNGIVLQERAGEAVLMAVVFDVRIIGPETEGELSVTIRVGGP